MGESYRLGTDRKRAKAKSLGRFHEQKLNRQRAFFLVYSIEAQRKQREMRKLAQRKSKSKTHRIFQRSKSYRLIQSEFTRNLLNKAIDLFKSKKKPSIERNKE